jgi:ATP-dependent Clp protease protease subunit
MNSLIKLFALNKGNSERKFEIQNAGNESTIYLYDNIVSDDMTAEWWGGVSATSFVKEINNIKADVVHLRINCAGGDVFAGRAMEQAIRQHKSKFVAHIDGYAASAASYVALACDEVQIAKGGFFMIHKAWTLAMGNADDMMKSAELLEKIDGSLAKTYIDETGQSEEDIKNWMKAETWFDADESVKYGFADSIMESKAKASWDLSAYEKAPKIEQKEEKEQPKEEEIEQKPVETEEKPEQEDTFLAESHRDRQLQRIRMLKHARIG